MALLGGGLDPNISRAQQMFRSIRMRWHDKPYDQPTYQGSVRSEHCSRFFDPLLQICNGVLLEGVEDFMNSTTCMGKARKREEKFESACEEVLQILEQEDSSPFALSLHYCVLCSINERVSQDEKLWYVVTVQIYTSMEQTFLIHFFTVS